MKQLYIAKQRSNPWHIHSARDNHPLWVGTFLWRRLLSQNTLLPLMIIVVGLSLFGMWGAAVAWMLIAVWSLRGVDEAFEALILSVLISMLNPAIFAILPIAQTLRWVVYGLAIARLGYALTRSQQTLLRFPGQTVFLLFVAYITVNAIFVSPLTVFSLVKAAQFALGVWVLYLGATQLVKRNWVDNIIGFGTVILFASFIASLVGFGYEKNGRGFQGITSHPQTLGVLLAITLAVAVAQWILKEAKITPFRSVVLLLLFWGLLLSEARTGAAALFISLSVSIFLLLGKNSLHWQKIFLQPIVYFAAAIVLLYSAINPTIGQSIIGFVRKSSDVELQQNQLLSSAGRLYYASRGTLLDLSMHNIRESPIWGIGFGVPSLIPFSSPTAAIHAFPSAVHFGNVPIWVDSEKGFIGTAALEETGAIGAVLLMLFLLVNVRALRKRADVVPLTLFMVALATNIGEATLFSFGGLGRYITVCMAVAVAAGHPIKP